MNLNTIKNNYDRGLWSEAMVAVAVKKGILSKKDYESIVLADYPDDENIENVKKKKVVELKKSCEEYISAGCDVEFGDGSIEHFSYGIEDQNNISEMFVAVSAGASEFPYHSDGNVCKVYGKEQIVAIYGTLSIFKTEATTYYNALRSQVEEMTETPEVRSVKYRETKLTGKHLENYNNMMASAKKQLETILQKNEG